MNGSLSATSRSRPGATRRVFYALVALVAIGAARASAQSDGSLLQRLDSIAGAEVVETRAVAVAILQLRDQGKLSLELIAPSKLGDGTPLRYSMGTSVAEDRRGLKYIGHNGGGFGFSSEARWYPDAQLAVVVLTNSEPDAITVTTEDLAAAVLPTPPSAGPFTGDISSLVGTYKGLGPGGDASIEVTQTLQGLAMSARGAPANPLVWIEGWRFRGRGGTLLTFRRSANGGPATELEVDTAGDHFILVRQ